MQTVQLSPRLAYKPNVTERSEAGVLMGEIAERLIELCEVQGEPKTQRWILRMAQCARDPECSRAIWYYLSFAVGDLSAITTSHSERGGKREMRGMCRSKQGEHKEHRRALIVVGRYFPEVARVLRELKP